MQVVLYNILFYSCTKCQPVFTGTQRKQVCDVCGAILVDFGDTNYLV